MSTREKEALSLEIARLPAWWLLVERDERAKGKEGEREFMRARCEED